MNIIICDDDILFLERFRERLESFLTERQILYKIDMLSSGEELLEHDILKTDLIFLDIEMGEINGLETARVLRKKYPDFVLVFLTGFLEYARDGYEVKALRYILKDQLDVTFYETMDAVITEMGLYVLPYTFDFVNGQMTIYADDILYLESDMHTVKFYLTQNRKVRELYGTLNSIQELLPQSDFVRIHQSYLVNLKYVTYMDSATAKLIDGVKLPISRRKSPEARKAWFLYKGRS